MPERRHNRYFSEVAEGIHYEAESKGALNRIP
jgi:hypothetical protein